MATIVTKCYDHELNSWLQRFYSVVPTGGLYRVKAAFTRWAVPRSVAVDGVTWTYVSGWTGWCWRLLESLFPLCSFSVPLDQLRLVGGSERPSFPLSGVRGHQPGESGEKSVACSGPDTRSTARAGALIPT